MYGNSLLLAGISGHNDVTGPVIGYHGFKLQRHISNEATVITYKAADGRMKRMAVKDAQFRDLKQFGTQAIDVPGLTNFTSLLNASGNGMIHGITFNAIPDRQPMPDTVTNDVIYNQWHASLAADKTAKENCDIWMTYNNQTDRNHIKGVPAVAWCRSQVIDGKPCDLPNKYETIVIWVCGDKLDEMDPTAVSRDMRLGYTATTAKSGYGRCQKAANGLVSDVLFSSTEYDASYVHGVYYAGGCSNSDKIGAGTAVPILELD